MTIQKLLGFLIVNYQNQPFHAELVPESLQPWIRKLSKYGDIVNTGEKYHTFALYKLSQQGIDYAYKYATKEIKQYEGEVHVRTQITRSPDMLRTTEPSPVPIRSVGMWGETVRVPSKWTYWHKVSKSDDQRFNVGDIYGFPGKTAYLISADGKLSPVKFEYIKRLPTNSRVVLSLDKTEN
jgi:hypothetical protein